MNYDQWAKIYVTICEELHLDTTKDIVAGECFDHLIASYLKYYITNDTIRTIIQDKTIFVFGAAPSLDQQVKKNMCTFENQILIAADGATSCLIKYDIIPDIIVTDLDGVIADQLKANEKKSILVIHAHGDNSDVVQKTIPKIKGPYIGTIQTDPTNLCFVKNFGGFTDGDRAVFLADHFHAKKIVLVGFDCKKAPGFYSFQHGKKQNMKRKKLQWCDRLLSHFPDTYVRPI
jgi:2-amino-4-hydroxy-6-hydroxymethyldihydropteridine diphosphokinase